MSQWAVARSRSLLWIEMGGRCEPRAVIANGDVPAVIMHAVVVVAAEHDAVGEIGWAAVSVPPSDVVGLRMRRRAQAAGPGAAAVAFDERELLRRGEEPRGATEIERLARAAEDHRDHTGRGGEFTSRCSGNGLVDAVDRGVAVAGDEGVEIDSGHDDGAAKGWGRIGAREREPRDVGEGVSVHLGDRSLLSEEWVGRCAVGRVG